MITQSRQSQTRADSPKDRQAERYTYTKWRQNVRITENSQVRMRALTKIEENETRDNKAFETETANYSHNNNLVN